LRREFIGCARRDAAIDRGTAAAVAQAVCRPAAANGYWNDAAFRNEPCWRGNNYTNTRPAQSRSRHGAPRPGRLLATRREFAKPFVGRIDSAPCSASAQNPFGSRYSAALSCCARRRFRCQCAGPPTLSSAAGPRRWPLTRLFTNLTAARRQRSINARCRPRALAAPHALPCARWRYCSKSADTARMPCGRLALGRSEA